ncbi:tripartite tricarboxylate transporter substrate binding protein [Acidovorax sp. D4N7]|uniref:Tripartite tricarboxylate transporter substrate binding protein n=2 Tax=Comamonas endophytica TaxID=2949090 RepID=A0ABY6GFN8_9BURK|nr:MULTISPECIES: tripartite tricarboxylate transporter substrate binding protein [unclassified Acidovorax]MCD2512461.1 tripartite tricarboxylate transporter substrate binding protein [Acidovorax sp. D4N7]UYG53284.1 tripartite tricarboxylate transporter substrate binding protein [Acidovorax sp. 5MLIR]
MTPLPLAALAQPAPSDRPVRVVVPLAAGSTVDAVARAIAPGLGRATGHPIVVENVVGAGGIPGTTQVVKAARDGLTLGMISSNHVINPGIYKSIPYDTLRDITPIAVLATVPLVLVVNPKLPVKNVAELLAYAKAHPGTLNYGSAGNGSTLHLAGELMIAETGIDMRHVPYRGTGPLVTDLMGGQVQLGFVSISQVAPQIKAGGLRALALSTPTRSPALPDVPTMAQAGAPRYSFDAWIALVGPAGLPKATVDGYAAAVKTAMDSPEARAAIAGQGLMVLDKGPDTAPAFFQSELAKHQALVKQSGATLD